VLLPRQAGGVEQEETCYGSIVIRPFGGCARHRPADHDYRRHVLRQVKKAVATLLLLLRLVLRLVYRSQVLQADLLLLLPRQIGHPEEQVSRFAKTVPV